MAGTTRRRFLQGSVAAGLSLAAPFSRARGANDDIRVAVVGIRGQGTNHINWFRKIPGVRVVAICDADRAFVDREEKKVKDRGEKVACYVDVRKLLDDKSIDAVITASPVDADELRTVDEAVRDGGGQSDAMTPGLERLAFEFCGRDPGRIAEAAAGGTLGIQQLVDTVCPPDFVRVTVSDDEADKAASATTTPLCEEARRALAAAKHVGGDMPVLVVVLMLIQE